MTKAEVIKHPVEQIGSTIKKSAWFAVAESLMILILGILMVAWPDITIIVIANILGAIFVSAGIYQIVNYFIVKGQSDFFNNGLLSGVLSLLIGIAVLVAGEELASVFRIVIGIWMIYEALVRANAAIKLHAVGIKVWTYVLLISVCMLAIGIFVTFNAGAVISLIGWMMILTGVFGVVGDFMFMQYINTITDVLTGKASSKD